MATKIRLQRFGKKGKPFYHVVVADSRSPRDGKFIERLGSYNPNTNPATIIIDFDSTLDWMNKGAQPTDTCRAILSYKGILYKKHLQGGIAKGALTQETADAKFAEWLDAKSGKIEGKKEGLSQSRAEARKAALAAEAARKEKVAAAVALKNTPAEEEVEEVPVTDEAPETNESPEASETETPEAAETEAPVTEAPVEDVVEEVPAPIVNEAPAEEAPAAEAEAPVAEETANEVAPAVEETPVTETPADDTPEK